MKLTVTQEDIDKGIPTSCSKCPITLSAWRVFPNANDIWTSYYDLTVMFGDMSLDYTLPAEAQYFMAEFDEHKTGQPFTFEITNPN